MDELLHRGLEQARGLFARGEAQRAAESLESLSSRFPDSAELWLLQGQVYLESGQPESALTSLRKAAQLDPQSLHIATALSLALNQSGQGSEAYALLGAFFDSGASGFDAHLNMSHICLGLGRIEEGADHAEKALSIDPESATAATNRFLCQRIIAPLDAWRNLRDIALRQDGIGSLKAAAAESLYLSEVLESEVKELHDEVGKRLCEHISPTRRFMGKPVPDRPLKIGFLSADFRRHPVASFTLSFLEALDPEAFSLSFYSLNAQEDDVSQSFKALGQWRMCAGLRAVALASLIHSDAVDILIDLSGLTAGGRPEVLAMKPAPVVISAIGYPHDVGLTRVDGHLCDHITDPDSSQSTVQLLAVEPPFLCYRPYESPPPLAQSKRSGPPVWGAFCNVRKISKATVHLWSSVLKSVPDSTLLCMCQEFVHAEEVNRVQSLFSGLDIGERVVLATGPRNYRDYMLAYHKVDVVLDTYPFNGATTTMDAFLMGVPVLSLCGSAHRSRVGKCLAQSLGRGDWIAESPLDFVRVAISCGEVIESIRSGRENLRNEVEDSVLMDSSSFAGKFGVALRSAWVRYCDLATN